MGELNTDSGRLGSRLFHPNRVLNSVHLFLLLLFLSVEDFHSSRGSDCTLLQSDSIVVLTASRPHLITAGLIGNSSNRVPSVSPSIHAVGRYPLTSFGPVRRGKVWLGFVSPGEGSWLVNKKGRGRRRRFCRHHRIFS